MARSPSWLIRDVRLNIPMNRVILLSMMLAVLSGCTSVREWTRLDSPDRQASITVSSKERCGLYLIGPEPPRTIGKWARFVVEVRGRKVHDTGFRDIGRYQQIPHAFDVAWSPD